MPFIALENLWHRKLSPRDWLALVFLLIALTSFASVYIAWRHSQSALAIAVESRNALRAQRLQIDRVYCTAINQTRQINNRDRETLRAVLRQARRDLRVLKDPVLIAIVQKSIAETRHEIDIRPNLKLLPCSSLIGPVVRATRQGSGAP